MKCSVNVDSPCQNEAVEILYIKVAGDPVEEYPRCREHPAAGDIKAIRHVSPWATLTIEPIRPARVRGGS